MSFDRRQFLSLAGIAVLARFLGKPGEAWAAERNFNAFNARSPASVYAALGLAVPQESRDILIDVPDVAENGANVPVEVTVRLPNVQRVLLIGERNLFPLLADVSFSARSEPWFEAKVKLAETSQVRVIVQAGDKLYTAARTVKVIVGGCIAG